MIKKIKEFLMSFCPVNLALIPEVKGCDHDWFTIRLSDYIKYTTSDGDICIVPVESRYGTYYDTTYGTNKVCTLCGECDNGADEMDQAMAYQIKREKNATKIARRKRLWAEQLWKDGCKNG